MMTACLLGLIFAVASGFIDHEVMLIEHWICLIAYAAFLTFACMAILLPTSYLNKQMQNQMKRLIKRKEVYQRLVGDRRILTANPVTLTTRI